MPVALMSSSRWEQPALPVPSNVQDISAMGRVPISDEVSLTPFLPLHL